MDLNAEVGFIDAAMLLTPVTFIVTSGVVGVIKLQIDLIEELSPAYIVNKTSSTLSSSFPLSLGCKIFSKV
jgi:hypothetical protein